MCRRRANSFIIKGLQIGTAEKKKNITSFLGFEELFIPACQQIYIANIISIATNTNTTNFDDYIHFEMPFQRKMSTARQWRSGSVIEVQEMDEKPSESFAPAYILAEDEEPPLKKMSLVPDEFPPNSDSAQQESDEYGSDAENEPALFGNKRGPYTEFIKLGSRQQRRLTMPLINELENFIRRNGYTLTVTQFLGYLLQRENKKSNKSKPEDNYFCTLIRRNQ